ncbi:hypothetical protein LMG33818_002259 [Halomonadaceae bacterium LMG 33818]
MDAVAPVKVDITSREQVDRRDKGGSILRRRSVGEHALQRFPSSGC